MVGYTSVHRKNLYDLIVLDLLMPGTYLPVLALTAQPDHKQRALEAGAKNFLGKPFQFAEFTALVTHMLDHRLSHMQGINSGKEPE